MDITEVRIKLMEPGQEERLLAFCSITFDQSFVIRDLKIIRGTKGYFVAMPSRKLTDRCRSCGGKNQLRASYCNYCGQQLNENRSFKQPDGKAKLYSDIAHPINSECRDLIQQKVLEAYENELVLAKQPGYQCRYDDLGENDFHDATKETEVENRTSSGASRKVRIDSPQRQSSPPNEGVGNTTVSKNAVDQFGEGVF